MSGHEYVPNGEPPPKWVMPAGHGAAVSQCLRAAMELLEQCGHHDAAKVVAATAETIFDGAGSALSGFFAHEQRRLNAEAEIAAALIEGLGE